MDFDINTVRSAVLVLAFAGFIGVWVWAWSKKRKSDFEESANLPLEEDVPNTEEYSANNSLEKP